jgi:hypothetical protein
MVIEESRIKTRHFNIWVCKLFDNTALEHGDELVHIPVGLTFRFEAHVTGHEHVDWRVDFPIGVERGQAGHGDRVFDVIPLPAGRLADVGHGMVPVYGFPALASPDVSALTMPDCWAMTGNAASISGRVIGMFMKASRLLSSSDGQTAW